MANKVALAAQVAQDIGGEFLATIFQTGPTGQSTVTCGTEDSLLTPFHLSFAEEGDCAGVDWIVILMFALVIHAISWIPRPLYENAASTIMEGHKSWNDEEAKRFSMTATHLLFHTCSGFFVVRVLGPQAWIWDRLGWRDMQYTDVIQPDFKCYYLIYAARFTSDLVSIFFETGRAKDAFIAAFLHHVVTLGLVVGSAWASQTGYGGIIMFTFDWGDFPLLAAKLFKYLSKDPNDMFQFIANRLFELFALTFVLTRNIFYTYIVYSAIMDNIEVSLNIHTKQGKLAALLVALATLQTYWLGLLIQAVKRQKASGGNVEDIREKKKEA